MNMEIRLCLRRNLFDTATFHGQVAYKKVVQLKTDDVVFRMEDMEKQYLIPGQNRMESG